VLGVGRLVMRVVRDVRSYKVVRWGFTSDQITSGDSDDWC